jgi:hypothetical protein
MATFTRTSSNLIGSPASPASIAANASSTGTLAIASGGTLAEGEIGCAVIVGGSPPTTAPTVQFLYSFDGTNYLADGGAFIVPLTVSTTTYYGPYTPPSGAVDAQVIVTNGATNAITAWAQGATLGVS